MISSIKVEPPSVQHLRRLIDCLFNGSKLVKIMPEEISFLCI